MPGRRAPEDERREQILSAAYAVALRTGIAGVTLRAVAAEAGLSHGLLLFHFKRKEELVGALLDRVLATTVMRGVADGVTSEDGAGSPPRAADRLGAFLRHELERISDEPRGTRLFFEYWALGVHQAAIRKKIGAAMTRYRAAFRSMAEEILAAEPSRGRGAAATTGLTPDALAAVAVSLINGCAVQMMIDPDQFDTDAYLAAVQDLIARLVPSPTARRAPARSRP